MYTSNICNLITNTDIFILCKIVVCNQTHYISVKMGQNIIRIIYFHIIIFNLLISYIISFFIFPNCDMRTHVLPSQFYNFGSIWKLVRDGVG